MAQIDRSQIEVHSRHLESVMDLYSRLLKNVRTFLIKVSAGMLSGYIFLILDFYRIERVRNNEIKNLRWEFRKAQKKISIFLRLILLLGLDLAAARTDMDAGVRDRRESMRGNIDRIKIDSFQLLCHTSVPGKTRQNFEWLNFGIKWLKLNALVTFLNNIKKEYHDTWIYVKVKMTRRSSPNINVSIDIEPLA